MAEAAAHLTTTASKKPSIFEVVAQENLMATLQPALRHLCRVLATKNPEKFGWVERGHEELYLALNLIMQHQYLKHYGGSFAENFYGLERIPADLPSVSEAPLLSHRLAASHKLKSLLSLVLFPYIKIKLDRKFEKLREETADGIVAESPWLQRFRCAFLAVYPYLHWTWEILVLIYYFKYMFGKGRFHNPLLPLAGTELTYISEDRLQEIAARQKELLTWRGWRIEKIATSTIRALGMALSLGLEVGSFFLQFLDWWFSSDQRPETWTALPVPPPPTQSEGKFAQNPTMCPLCQQWRRNEAVLSVSGYVFCYPCIFVYLRENQRCPVTGYPATLEQLIRLFPPGS